MPAPTVTFAGVSNVTDVASADSVTGVAWSTGDLILVLGMSEDQSHALSTPSNANLTFAALSGLPTTTASSCKGYGWSATAASSQTAQTISTTVDSAMAMIGVYVISGSSTTGLGTPATATSTAKTVSLTRVADNSVVAWVAGDWSADTDVTVDPSPAGGTQRAAGVSSGRATMFLFDWPDQGAAGGTSYGIANASGTGALTKVAVEIKGTVGVVIPDLVMAPMRPGGR